MSKFVSADVLTSEASELLSNGMLIRGEILPTVGRVVWFTPSCLTGHYGFTHIDSRKPLAAVVSHVFNDGLVNLSVFDSNGTPFSRTSVPLVQAGEAKPEHGYFCEWMSYQVGQAAKQAKPAY